MQSIIAVIFAMYCVSVLHALKCHQNKMAGDIMLREVAGSNVLRRVRYRRLGVCYVDSDGQKGIVHTGFRGRADFVCMQRYWIHTDRTYKFPVYYTRCYCATDGCNAKLPAYGVPDMHCTRPNGTTFMCGGTKTVGSSCGTQVIVTNNDGRITVKKDGFCVVSLGNRGCESMGVGRTLCVSRGYRAG